MSPGEERNSMSISMSTWGLPATLKQKRAVARLLQGLGIHEEYEQLSMTRDEARDFIYRLRGELRARKREVKHEV